MGCRIHPCFPGWIAESIAPADAPDAHQRRPADTYADTPGSYDSVGIKCRGPTRGSRGVPGLTPLLSRRP